MGKNLIDSPWKVRLVKEIMKTLPKFSVNNLVKMAALAETLTSDEDLKSKARGMKEFFATGHPSVNLAKSIINRLSPTCRDKLIQNFFLNESLLGAYRREEILCQTGVEPPFFMVISPTMRCNLHCYGCYAGEYEQSFGLEFELVDRILNEAKDLGMYFITISGGEPFVWKHLLEMFEKHNDVYFQIYTNGTLIDEQMAQRLAQLGNAVPVISIEGFEKRTEERRGKGTYKKIMAAMDYLREAGVVFGGSITETRENIELVSSEELVDMLIDKGAMLIWYFQYIPIGRKPKMELMPTPEQRDMLRRRLIYLRANKPIFIGDFWNDGPHVDGCIAGGRKYLHINANGDVEPCVFTHFAVDNIREKSLWEAINSNLFRAIRCRQPYSRNLLTPCMIIDQPWVLREVVAKSGAHPTHPGAETIIADLKDKLDEYSKAYHKIADLAWEEEWAGRRAYILADEKYQSQNLEGVA
jgi:MoaA/NifB/PqqE/SkfB family radical SAM enzyme